MSLSLHERVAQTARAATRLQWTYAALQWGAGTTMILAGLGIIDAVWRGHDLGTRLLLSLSAALGLAALAWRCFRPVAASQMRLLDVARRIDSYYPELEQRLASAIAFQARSEQDPLAGSAELRRQVVAQTESRAANLDFRAVLNHEPTHRAARRSLVVFAAAALLIALAPRSSATALTRIALPLARIDWPRQYDLHWIEAPRQAARGQTVELLLGGRLPQTVELQLQFSASGQIERRPMRLVDGRMTYSLANVTEPLRYRAVGGDDDTMPWTELAIVDPPELSQFETTIVAPAYTGWPAQQGRRVMRVLGGSSASISGEFDRTIRSARLSPTTHHGSAIVGEVTDEGRAFRIPARRGEPLVIRESGRWQLAWEDEQGIVCRGAEEWEFRVVTDAPPTITWQSPRENAYATSQARLPLRAIIRDDLGIATIELRVWRKETDAAPDQTVVLYQNDDRENVVASLEGMAQGTLRQLNTHWRLKDHLPELQPGDAITIGLATSDFSPQTSVTPFRQLLILSEEDFQKRAQQRQQEILVRLSETVNLSRDARTPTREVEMKWQETKTVGAADAAQLQHAEFLQRQALHALAEEGGGIHGQVEQLLEDLRDNLLGGDGLAKQLEQLHTVTGDVTTGLLPQAAQSLGAALKELRISSAEQTPPLALLQSAGRFQDQALERLETILSQLHEFDTLARLARETSRLREDQGQLREQSEQLLLNLAAAGPDELPARNAESRQLSQQQFELTRQLDRLLLRIGDLHRKLKQTPGDSAGTLDLLTDALDAARRTGISGLMQEAGRGLAVQRVGSAVQAQTGALAGLSAVVDALYGQAEQELKKRIEQLEAAAKRLDDLIGRQDRERQAVDRAMAERNAEQRLRQLARVARSEERLAADVSEWRQQLESLRAASAATAAEKAKEQLSATAAAASNGQGEAAQDAAREAQQSLEVAKRALRANLRQAQAELVQEEMARLEQLIGDLESRQQTLVKETVRLELLRKEREEWDRTQLAALQTVISDQRRVAEETESLAADLQSPTFALTLRGASVEMRRALGKLARNEVGKATQQAQQAALNRLGQMRKVLEERAEESSAQPESQQEEPQEDQPPNVQSVNELKLLLLLQQELNRRTKELDAQRLPGADLSAELMQQIAGLAAEQGQVAQIVQNLLLRSQSPMTTPPDLPPGVPPADNEK